MHSQFPLPTMWNIPGVVLKPYTELPSPPIPKSIQITVNAPLYNRAPILEASLRSYLAQNFPKEAFEVLMVDDASDDNTREVVEEICKKYSTFNIRCYFLGYTRCYNNIHPSNVGYREGLGSIIMNTHMDVILTPNVFEAGWRHLNATHNLHLNPRHYGIDGEHEKEAEKLIAEGRYEEVVQLSIPWGKIFREPGYPNEFGAMLRKEYFMKIHGNDEKIIREPGDADQWCRLATAGVIYGEDSTVSSIHRVYSKRRPPPFDYKKVMQERGTVFNPPDPVKNKDGNWGLMTLAERGSVIMTESMRRVLEGE